VCEKRSVRRQGFGTRFARLRRSRKGPQGKSADSRRQAQPAGVFLYRPNILFQSFRKEWLFLFLAEGMCGRSDRFEGKDLDAQCASSAEPKRPAGQIRRLTEAGAACRSIPISSTRKNSHSERNGCFWITTCCMAYAGSTSFVRSFSSVCSVTPMSSR